MVSGNAENKTAFENGMFLKVDNVEPAFNTYFSPYECTRVDGIKVWIGGEGHLFPCDHYTVCYPDAVREDGRRQVVELAKELTDMLLTDKNKLFGNCSTSEILSRFSYEDIVKKLDAWKKEKKEIRVRDEVYHQANETRFVITKIYAPCDGDVIVNGLKRDGTAIKGLLLCNVKKTGLHVDDLDAYLEV